VYRGRFAPSPTGPLHLGSLVAAVASYADTLKQAGEWFVRIDNIDPPREDPDAIQRILASLDAHGFFIRNNGAHDIGQRSVEWSSQSTSIVLQGDRDNQYQSAVNKLTNNGLVFACECTRKSLASIECYPGTCEQANLSPERDGLWAYQLANVVDDANDSVSDIVRGFDLLDNTPRQLAMYQCLDEPAPRYCHVPVLCDSDGNKLSKQTGAQALEDARAIQNLQQVWCFLGQSDVTADSISEFWQKAATLWDRKRVAKQISVAK